MDVVLIVKKIRTILTLCFTLSVFVILSPLTAKAEVLPPSGVEVYMNPTTGNVKITMAATTASTNTTWETIGFTVNKKKVDNYNPQKPYGKFKLEDGERKDDPKDNGITISTFKFNYENVSDQYTAAGINSKTLEESGGTVWLCGFFQANYESGGHSSAKYTLDGILNNAGVDWPSYVEDDIKTRFNIPFNFNPPPQPIKLTLIKWSKSSGYKEVSSELVTKLPTHSTCKVTTFSINGTNYSIPGTIDSAIAGKKLYMYRIQWSSLDDEKKYGGGVYRYPRDRLLIDSSTNPLINWEGYKTALYPLRNRSGVSTDKKTEGCPFYEVIDGGIEIVCFYKNFSLPPTDEDGTTKEISEDIIEPYTIETIQADNRFNEKFNSEQGIPTSETQYVCAYTEEYLLQYKFVHYSGWKEFLQVAGKTYVVVKRSYSYWKIEDLNVYSISYARASNYSLPSGQVYLTPTSYYNAPRVNYQIHSTNLVEPVGGGTSVGEYTVWNDSLTFNGELIMDSTRTSTAAPTPKSMPKSGKANAYALYQSGYMIEGTKANGECGSEGIICYTRTTHYGDEAEGPMITYDVDEINDVTIHTPVICDAKIEDVRKYNQLIRPSQSIASLVLDTYFNVSLPTYGYHSDLKGYGSRDYAKYTASKEVKFPFDVMKNSTYLAAGTWTTIGDTTRFYLPVWVDEGQYTVEFRTLSINCDANSGINKTEDLANTDYENYVAADSVDVEVSGRVYNFNLYDVSDYPIWQSVFRNTNSLTFNGTNYTVGIKDRNEKTALDWTKTKERSSKYTLPLMNGSHPTYSEIGAIKTGYYTRFSVDTIGDYDGIDDYIRITPKFYFVNEKGHCRQEVDLYYTQYFESTNRKQILVKIGSALDQNNIHSIDRKDTYLTGGALKGTPCTKKNKNKVYTFGNIMIPDTLMSYTGNPSYFQPLVCTNNSKLLSLQNQSVQTWICEYYLPTKLYVCAKDYDVASYAKNNGGLTFDEAFWLKDGYLIVNFQIETIQNKERHLSYVNTENAINGWCNMWKMEGGVSSKKDIHGNTYSIMDGDYVMYEIGRNKNVNYDYKTGGIY